MFTVLYRVLNYSGTLIAFGSMMTTGENICPLCGRVLAGICNRHHLIPATKGGKNTPTIVLHKISDDKIHAVFTENE